METAEIISELEFFRRVSQRFEPPVGPLVDMGIELAELIVAFVADEDRDKAMDQLRALIRSGMKASVTAELDQKFGG